MTLGFVEKKLIDLRSEFLCQSSLIAEHTDPPLNYHVHLGYLPHPQTLYHPYCHKPSALTEYLKEKLRKQHAKRLSRSHSAQVKPNIQLKHNIPHSSDHPFMAQGSSLGQLKKAHNSHPLCLTPSSLTLAQKSPLGQPKSAHNPKCVT